MSTTQPDDRRPVSELLAMDESEAKQTLSWAEYQRYESLTEHHDRADENRADLDAADEQVHGLIARTDVSDLAADVDVFGNELVCYYGPEDEPVQDAAQRLADIFDADPSDPEGSIDTEDVSDDDLEDAKDALADLLFAAVIEWNGERGERSRKRAGTASKSRSPNPGPKGGGSRGSSMRGRRYRRRSKKSEPSAWTWYGSFATRHGAGLVEVLDKTGFRSYGEFRRELPEWEQRLIVESIKAYHEEQHNG